HQHLNDLLYVHFNLRLQQRNYFKHRNYDPIKFEVFHENTNWVLEDEPTNLTMEELETFQNELAACTIQDNQNDIELVEDDDNDDGDPSNQYEATSEEPNENEDLI
ncbi:hypothetical protein RGQ29_018245, partial [Quercus rubra]